MLEAGEFNPLDVDVPRERIINDIESDEIINIGFLLVNDVIVKL